MRWVHYEPEVFGIVITAARACEMTVKVHSYLEHPYEVGYCVAHLVFGATSKAWLCAQLRTIRETARAQEHAEKPTGCEQRKTWCSRIVSSSASTSARVVSLFVRSYAQRQVLLVPAKIKCATQQLTARSCSKYECTLKVLYALSKLCLFLPVMGISVREHHPGGTAHPVATHTH